MTISQAVLPPALLPFAPLFQSGAWMIALNAIDPQGRLIDHPTPGLPGRLFCAFEYYAAGHPTVFAEEAFGMVFEFPTPHGTVSPIHTGHQPAPADDPLFTAVLAGGCVNASLPYYDQLQWQPMVSAFLTYLQEHSPLRLWTVDPYLHLTDRTGRWTWKRIGHADDTKDTWDRPLYRFEHFTPHIPTS